MNPVSRNGTTSGSAARQESCLAYNFRAPGKPGIPYRTRPGLLAFRGLVGFTATGQFRQFGQFRQLGRVGADWARKTFQRTGYDRFGAWDREGGEPAFEKRAHGVFNGAGDQTVPDLSEIT